MKTIEIVVSPAGEIKIETKGFAGAACQSVSRSLEQALGQRTAEILTAEFYAAQQAQQQHQQT